jgi:hypothetical protein
VNFITYFFGVKGAAKTMNECSQRISDDIGQFQAEDLDQFLKYPLRVTDGFPEIVIPTIKELSLVFAFDVEFPQDKSIFREKKRDTAGTPD